MKSDKKKGRVDWFDIALVLGLIVGVTLLWWLSSVLIDKYLVRFEGELEGNYLAQRGTFGDKFGAINALFSGLAFAGIIYTIYLQRGELALQRQELEDTRQEFIQQNETLKKQRFENTFF